MQLTDAIILRIEELKKEKKLTQYMLSMKSTVPQTTLISIKRKRSRSVQISTIYLLCVGFEISLKDFFDSPLFGMDRLDF